MEKGTRKCKWTGTNSTLFLKDQRCIVVETKGFSVSKPLCKSNSHTLLKGKTLGNYTLREFFQGRWCITQDQWKRRERKGEEEGGRERRRENTCAHWNDGRTIASQMRHTSWCLEFGNWYLKDFLLILKLKHAAHILKLLLLRAPFPRAHFLL